MIEFQNPGNFEKTILFFDENLRLETIFYRIFVNFSGYFVTICCHLFEKGIMTEQFDTKRSRFIMGRNSLSSHNHALKTWMQNMLYKVAKIDFWQAITPLWPPHHQRATTTTSRSYFTKSIKDHGHPGLTSCGGPVLYITLLMTLVYDFLQQFNVDAKNGVKIEEQTPTILLSFANFFWPNFSLKNSHSHLKIVFRASRKNWTEFKSDYKLAFTPLWTAVLPLIYMEKSGWKWTVLCICL